MLSTVLLTIRRHGLAAAGDRVLVAVSGGPDPMALLGVLWEVGPRLGLTLEVATVDHGLRRDVAAELELVAARAQALGLPWHRLTVDVRAAGIRGGLQEAARRSRLAALAALAAERGCARVALGHQADDQTETVLFRILRGTGVAGLKGIPYQRPPFVRPLLDVTRAQILRYLRRRSLPFASDPSNADPRFARARLRHHVLPMLREENPRVDEALRRLAEEAAWLPVVPDPLLPIERDTGIHLSARARKALVEAVGQGGSRSFDVAGGQRLSVAYGRVTAERRPRPLGKRGARRGSEAPPPDEKTIAGPGTYSIGPESAVIVRAEEGAAREPGLQTPGWAWFDADRLAWPLVLRVRRPGDRMRPRGGRGSRKLSDLLIDAKVPRRDRARWPVVAGGDGELLYVPGLRPSQAGEPSDLSVHLVGMLGTFGGIGSQDRLAGLARGVGSRDWLAESERRRADRERHTFKRSEG